MKSEKIFYAIGQISDDKIMEADVEAAAAKPVKLTILRWGAVAACVAVALMVTIPMLQRDTGVESSGETEPGIITGTAHGDMAYKFDDLNIYYVTGDGELAFESVYIRYVPEDVFIKWAELNNVVGVTFIKAFLDSNGFETIHGDPDDPETVVQYTIGDRFTLEITLSPEYKAYAEGENGELLAESLERTFRGYNDSIELDEFSIIISEP